MSILDPQEYARVRLASHEREFVWHEGVDEAWRSGLKHRLCQSIGLKREDFSLDPECQESVRQHGYRRDKVSFQCRPGLRLLGYLLVPDAAEMAPGVVCVPGHGVGVDALIDESSPDYQHAFAVQCVKAGFVTLAIEPAGFGHRKSKVPARSQGSGVPVQENSCVRDSMAALMLGETMIAWRVLEAMAAIDYLQGRAETDSDKIATMGISGGGMVAFWTACLDGRVQAAVVSGYFNTFADSILSIDHCVDNFAPGLATIVEMPDMAALIAPRRLYVESGSRDPIFPAEAFTRACRRAEAIFKAANAGDSFGWDLFDGDHEFNGAKAIPRLAQWMSEPLSRSNANTTSP